MLASVIHLSFLIGYYKYLYPISHAADRKTEHEVHDGFKGVLRLNCEGRSLQREAVYSCYNISDNVSGTKLNVALNGFLKKRLIKHCRKTTHTSGSASLISFLHQHLLVCTRTYTPLVLHCTYRRRCWPAASPRWEPPLLSVSSKDGANF